jgi:hypothetical protein
MKIVVRHVFVKLKLSSSLLHVMKILYHFVIDRIMDNLVHLHALDPEAAQGSALEADIPVDVVRGGSAVSHVIMSWNPSVSMTL